MEEKLSIKINALEILEKQLKNRAKKNQHGIIVLASATDPYLHVEKKYELTRRMLELIHKYRFPVHIITKSDLVARDFDLLEKINRDAILPLDLQSSVEHKVFITFSFSTIDDAVGKIFEPGATPPSKRLITLKATLTAKFHSGVSLMPLLPYITDSEEQLELMFRKFQQLGVRYILPASLTLFGDGTYDSKTLMLTAIQKHYPLLEEKYNKLFSYSYSPPSWYRNTLQKRIDRMIQKYQLKNTLGQLPL